MQEVEAVLAEVEAVEMEIGLLANFVIDMDMMHSIVGTDLTKLLFQILNLNHSNHMAHTI